MTKIPPFYVGQRVVCVRSSGWAGGVEKDVQYTVKSIALSTCKCGGYDITVGILADVAGNWKCRVCDTKVYKSIGDVVRFSSGMFAPIHTDYQEIKWEEVITFSKPCAQ